jgi:hypothetical protein
MDDFKGWFCNLGTFPILGAIKEELELKVRPLDGFDPSGGLKISSTTLTSNNLDQNGRLQSTTSSNNKFKTTAKFNSSKSSYTVFSISTISTSMKNTTTSRRRANISNQNDQVSSENNEQNGPTFKFKAVREIKLIACLDNKNKCTLKSDSSKLLKHASLQLVFTSLMPILIRYY